MKHRIYLPLLLFVFPFFLMGQKAPGYLGKRFSIEYNAFLFPSFQNPNRSEYTNGSSDDFRQEGSSVNLQQYFLTQWSISKKLSLVGSIGFVKTNFLPDDNNSRFRFDAYPGLKVINYNLGLRVFTQHFAPLGQYFEFRLGVAQLKTGDFSYNYVDYDGNVLNATIKGGTMTRPSIAVGYGVNRILMDILVLSYGVDVSFFAGGFGNNVVLTGEFINNDFEYTYEEGSTAGNEKELLSMAAGRYGLHCALNVKVGIGILL